MRVALRLLRVPAALRHKEHGQSSCSCLAAAHMRTHADRHKEREGERGVGKRAREKKEREWERVA